MGWLQLWFAEWHLLKYDEICERGNWSRLYSLGRWFCLSWRLEAVSWWNSKRTQIGFQIVYRRIQRLPRVLNNRKPRRIPLRSSQTREGDEQSHSAVVTSLGPNFQDKGSQKDISWLWVLLAISRSEKSSKYWVEDQGYFFEYGVLLWVEFWVNCYVWRPRKHASMAKKRASISWKSKRHCHYLQSCTKW